MNKLFLIKLNAHFPLLYILEKKSIFNFVFLGVCDLAVNPDVRAGVLVGPGGPGARPVLPRGHDHGPLLQRPLLLQTNPQQSPAHIDLHNHCIEFVSFRARIYETRILTRIFRFSW